jgi:hypothetical protein
MLINEILGIKKFQGMTREQIVTWVRQHGDFKFLGSGYASHVFEYNGAVYKFWVFDPPYEKFVAYALNHQDNPFLPKFRSGIRKVPASFMKKHKDQAQNVKWIKMEKLQVGDRASIPKVVVVDSGDPIGLDLVIMFASMSDPESNGRFYPQYTRREYLENRLLWESAKSEFEKRGRRLEDKAPGKLNRVGNQLIDLMMDLIAIAEKGKLELDDKHDNFGLRGSQGVILDPFWSKAAVAKNQRLNVFDFADAWAGKK